VIVPSTAPGALTGAGRYDFAGRIPSATVPALESTTRRFVRPAASLRSEHAIAELRKAHRAIDRRVMPRTKGKFPAYSEMISSRWYLSGVTKALPDARYMFTSLRTPISPGM